MRFGLIGYPLEHSLSPLVHAELGDYPYELRPLPEEEFDAFMRARDFEAVNVTLPYKQRVIPYCDRLTDRARACGSVNLLSRRPDGTLLGDNTDYAGLIALIRRSGMELAGSEVVLLGSGGTSHTARAVLESLDVREITVVSRRGPLDYDRFAEEYADREFYLINTTPVGMFPHGEVAPLDLYDFPSCLGVLDVIYNPVKSRLCDDADQLGLPWAGGLRMLVAQAAAAAPYFGGKSHSADEVDAVYENILHRLQNIVLVGMPGSGKSTVGRLIAKASGRPFYDSDALFVEENGITPGECIRRFGAEGFANRESEILLSLAQKQGSVIAAGSGAVLEPSNMDALRRSSVIFWVRRDAGLLCPTEPALCPNPAALYAERAPFYEMESDFSIDNNGAPEKAAADLWEVFSE